MTRFVQIHTLASYPAALLNRDDAGMAKRLPYGGASRIRVSSQCLKRHWRTAEDRWALKEIGAPMAWRSRQVVERAILPALSGPPESVEAVGTLLIKRLYGEKNVELSKRQALLLGEPEIHYLTRAARQAVEAGSTAKAIEAALDAELNKGDGKRNLAALKAAGRLAAGLEAALFGRMVTSDPEANTDAAIHVAHAFTVHAEEAESDYFTVVDDLTRDAGETGSAGIFETELTSGLFYGYVVVDRPALIANLGGDDDALAAKVIEHLVHLIATVSPGAKKGGTAPYGWADLMLIEKGERQPRSLAGAFRKPVRLKEDVLRDALAALTTQLAAFDESYGGGEERGALCTTHGVTLPGIARFTPLDELARWAGDGA